MKKPRISFARVFDYIESKYPGGVLPEREISDRGFVMSKFFAVMLSVLFLVAAAVPAMATDTRQMSLAGVGNYIEDDFNIFTWYATLPSYSNTVWIGLDYYYYGYYYGVKAAAAADGMAAYTSFLGASYGLGADGKYGTLAMFFYGYGPPLNADGYSWSNEYVFEQGVSNKWTVLYAYPMEKLSLGFYFNRSDGSSKYEDETETTYESALAYTTLGAGIRFDIGEKAYADIAFDYNMASETERPNSIYSTYWGYGEVTEDANKMMGARARMFYEWNETVTLVPFVNYRSYDFSLKADSADWKDTHYGDKGMMFGIGLGANVKVNEDNLLIFAVEPYNYSKFEPSDPPANATRSTTYTDLPVFYLALESDLKDWLTFRTGAQKGFYKSKYESETTVGDETTKDIETYTGSWFDYYMGLGFHVGDFDIDALVSTDLPFKLGYWLTGYDGWSGYYDAPVYKLTAAYHF
jgi:hypothetical protein